ncbi:MAG: laccase domain-containing protein, partial [Clostridiales bacterium]|nr:laccase domain-containing protein [Clostridiales bacterium]
MKINEKKDYVISEIAKCKVIFTKRNVFNFSRFLEMNQETIDSFINLEELFAKEEENINCLYVPNAEHTNIVVNLDTCTYYKMVQYNKLVLKMPKPLCDGIITKDKSKSLVVFPGDCIVVAGVHQTTGVRFIFHAGWRGVSQNIAKNIAIELKKLGVKLEEIQLVIFPSISEKHFTLDLKNSEVFSDYPAFVKY